MHTMRLRSRTLYGFLALLTLLAFLLGSWFWGRTEEYHPRLLVSFPWTEGDFAPAVTAGGMLYGPRTFALGPDGSIVVADSNSGSLLIFDQEGRYLGRSQVPVNGRIQWDDMVITEDGRIYLVNNAKPAIDVIDIPGGPLTKSSGVRAIPRTSAWQESARHIATVADFQSDEVQNRNAFAAELDSGKVVRLEALAPWAGKLFFSLLEIDRQKYTRKLFLLERLQQARPVLEYEIRPDSAANRKPGSEMMFHTLAVSGRGELYLDVSQSGSFDRELVKMSADGKIEESMRLPLDQWPRSFDLLGVDRAGAIYAGVNLGTESGFIRKYDAAGRLIWQVSAPQQEKVHTNTWARIDDRGSIYLFKPSQQGIQIEKWELTTNFNILP